MFRMSGRIFLITFLLYSVFSLNSLVFCQAPEIPLPSDAVKTMDKNANIGPSETNLQTYETSLSQDRVNSFYKREMARMKWNELRPGAFLKDGYMVVVTTVPPKNKSSKTRFTVFTASIPTKEEVLAGRKTTPDKLSFMPIYPGSTQTFKWDIPYGISASYGTESSIQEVVFFYKSGMLNYGWELYDEVPVSTKSADCPECRKAAAKLSQNTGKLDSNTISTKASLTFRKEDGESCIIRLYQTSSGMQNLTDSAVAGNNQDIVASNKTTILVTYNANKKINP